MIKCRFGCNAGEHDLEFRDSVPTEIELPFLPFIGMFFEFKNKKIQIQEMYYSMDK